MTTPARTQETLSADLAGICARNAAIHRATEADLAVKLRAVQIRLYGEGM